MFGFFKKKPKEEDPILRLISQQTEELKSITDSMRKQNESLDAEIQEGERILLNMGYTQEDLDKLRKSNLKVVK